MNIGNPNEFSIKELANLIRNLVNPNLEFEYKQLPEDDPKQRKPSIKLAPLITNKKQRSTKIEENKWLFIKNFKNWISTFDILIGKKNMNINSKKTIARSLFEGFIFIFKSSKNPIKNIEELIKIYSYKIFP